MLLVWRSNDPSQSRLIIAIKNPVSAANDTNDPLGSLPLVARLMSFWAISILSPLERSVVLSLRFTMVPSLVGVVVETEAQRVISAMVAFFWSLRLQNDSQGLRFDPTDPYIKITVITSTFRIKKEIPAFVTSRHFRVAKTSNGSVNMRQRKYLARSTTVTVE